MKPRPELYATGKPERLTHREALDKKEMKERERRGQLPKTKIVTALILWLVEKKWKNVMCLLTFLLQVANISVI